MSVVLLCFNEEDNVNAALDEALAVCERHFGRAWEVVVVDDGSTDATAALVRERASQDARLRLVSHGRNLGYGEAMLTGLREARGELILLTDGDLQFQLDDVERLLPFHGEYDIVQGRRARRADPFGRIMLGYAYRLFVRTLFELPVRDPECAFRLFRAESVRGIACRSRGDLVPVELLWRGAREGLRIVDVDVRHRTRRAGTSKALSIRNTLQLARDLVRVRLS